MIRIALPLARVPFCAVLVLAALLTAAPVGLPASAWAASPPSASRAAAAAPGPEAAHPDVRVVQEFSRQYAAGNLDGVRALFAPEVEWTVTGDNALAGTMKGMQRILQHLSQMRSPGVPVAADLVGAVGGFVLDARPGAVQRGGVLQQFVWVRVYELRGGRIVRVREFPSDQEAADVFIWHAFPPPPKQEPIIDYPPRPGQ